MSLPIIFISWHFWPPEAPQELNYNFTSQTRFAAHASSRFSERNVDRTRESSRNRAYVQLVEKKTESETANCREISQYTDENVAALRRLEVWRCWLQGFATREYKTPGTQCAVHLTAGNTPVVSADRCVNCSQRAGIVTWNLTKNPSDYNFKIPLRPLKKPRRFLYHKINSILKIKKKQFH